MKLNWGFQNLYLFSIVRVRFALLEPPQRGIDHLISSQARGVELDLLLSSYFFSSQGDGQKLWFRCRLMSVYVYSLFSRLGLYDLLHILICGRLNLWRVSDVRNILPIFYFLQPSSSLSELAICWHNQQISLHFIIWIGTKVKEKEIY